MSFNVIVGHGKFTKICFDHVKRALLWTGERTGATGTIVLGAHDLAPGYELPPDAIIYNFEQVDPAVSVFKEDSPYLKRLKEHRVFDYSTVNVNRLKYLHGIDAEYVPLRYSPEFHSSITARVRRDRRGTALPLFYGSMNARRRDFCEANRSRLMAYFGLWGRTLYSRLGATKALVNVHYYPSAIFEIVRCSIALANGIGVMSEHSTDAFHYPISDLFHTLPEITERLLKGDYPDGNQQLVEWLNTGSMLDVFDEIDWDE